MTTDFISLKSLNKLIVRPNLKSISTNQNTDNKINRFVTSFAPPCGFSSRSLPRKAGLLNFCYCTQDRFVLDVAPGHRHVPPIKSCTVTTFWLGNTARDRCLRRLTPTKLCRQAIRLRINRDKSANN